MSILLLAACGNQMNIPGTSPSHDMPPLCGYIKVPHPAAEQSALFNTSVPAEKITVNKGEGILISGYVTSNATFMGEVMKPLAAPYIDSLRKMHPVESVNALTLFVYESYLVYFGSDKYHTWDLYRWGGDLLDLDDPQEEGHRHEYRFGLDCSGFVSAPYELAVDFGILRAEDEAAAFSSRGFAVYGKNHGIQDKGGRKGTSNRFRVDSSEMSRIGREIISIEKGGVPEADALSKLQPGDVVTGPGHAGIIARARGELYYLEFGRTVIPLEGMIMTHAEEGLQQFARDYPLKVRRVLPDEAK